MFDAGEAPQFLEHHCGWPVGGQDDLADGGVKRVGRVGLDQARVADSPAGHDLSRLGPVEFSQGRRQGGTGVVGQEGHRVLLLWVDKDLGQDASLGVGAQERCQHRESYFH